MYVQNFNPSEIFYSGLKSSNKFSCWLTTNRQLQMDSWPKSRWTGQTFGCSEQLPEWTSQKISSHFWMQAMCEAWTANVSVIISAETWWEGRLFDCKQRIQPSDRILQAAGKYFVSAQRLMVRMDIHELQYTPIYYFNQMHQKSKIPSVLWV